MARAGTRGATRAAARDSGGGGSGGIGGGAPAVAAAEGGGGDDGGEPPVPAATSTATAPSAVGGGNGGSGEYDAWPAEVGDTNQPQFAAIRDVLAVCGLTEARQYRAFRAHGVARLKDFEVLGDDNALSNLVSHYRKKSAGEGGVNIGEIHVQNLRALIYWTRDRRRRGKTPKASAFTEKVMDMCIRKRRAEVKAKEDKPDPPNPGKLDPAKWHHWELAFDNFLSAFDGADGVPLNYVIRKEKEIGKDHKWTDPRERLKYEAKLKGEVFRVDSARVFTLLKQSVIGTLAWTWIEKFDKKQDGRKAMQKLREHYDGPGEVEKKRAAAKYRLDRLHYKDEPSLAFEKYVTFLKEVFQDLEECGRPLQEIEKVEHMLDKIQRNDGTIQALKVQILGDKELKNDFEASANHLSQALAVLHPGAGKKADKRYVAGLRKGGGKNGGGRKDQYKLKNGKVNGVDVSDPFRTFSKSDWNKLGPYRKAIFKLREDKKSSGEDKKAFESQISSLEAAIRKRSAEEVTDNGGGSNDDQDRQAAAVGKNGKKKPKKDAGGGPGTGPNGKVVSGPRRKISSSRRNKDLLINTVPNHHSTLEADNHADTFCCGSNFTVIGWTDREANVNPFYERLDSADDIPIAICATGFKCKETGETFILEVNEALWFGADMEVSLASSNQMRAYGLDVCDDPYDPHHPFGIQDPRTGIFIPFRMEGSFAVMDTFVPTQHELNTCRRIVLTSPEPWNPATAFPSSLSKEEEERERIVSMANIERTVSFGSNPTPRMGTLGESDVILGEISPALSPIDMVEKMIASVQVATHIREDPPDTLQVGMKRTIDGVSSGERHSRVDAEMLSRKWGIGLRTANQTLRVTTQFGVRHALHPLKRRYRSGPSSLQYRRLN